MTDANFDLMVPPKRDSLRMWLKGNVLKSPLHILISLASLLIAGYVIANVLDWAVLSANWTGSTRADCTKSGACWPFVYARFNQFIYGFYPVDQQWRVNIVGIVLLVGFACLLIKGVPYKRAIAVFLALIFPFLAFLLLHGGLGLEVVPTSKWGGLTLTLTIAVVAIAVSLPLGTILALARRSNMPVVSALAIGFIEVLRAVPLISVLFMASVLLPLFLPTDVTIDKLLRALVGVALFASAYMAEVVRGGLQALPDGQAEAARSLGLSPWKVNVFVVLPQALRISIPGIVNTFIAIFKDTSLVIVIGLFDLLGMVNASVNDPNWTSLEPEGYAFAAAIYWLFCSTMSRISMHLEKQSQFGY